MAASFGAYETIAFTFPSQDLAGHDIATARQLVSDGKKRWAQRHGGKLALVPIDYQLGQFEHFLVETSPNRFDFVTDEIEPRPV